MRFLLLVLLLLMSFSCTRPIQGSTGQLATLPEELKHLPIGGSVDLGYGFEYTRISEGKGVLHGPVAGPVNVKIKNSGNTTYTDNSKDKSKVKDQSDNSITDKSKPETYVDSNNKNKDDNRVDNSTGSNKGNFIVSILFLVLGLLFLIGVFLLVRKVFL